jgi:hypothetical protein
VLEIEIMLQGDVLCPKGNCSNSGHVCSYRSSDVSR